jgi:hypothetical protein
LALKTRKLKAFKQNLIDTLFSIDLEKIEEAFWEVLDRPINCP